MTLGLFIASLALNYAVTFFSFSSVADIAAFPALSLILGAYGLLTQPLENALSRWRENMADNDREDLASAFRTELFNDTIYVLTPHGKVLSLPVGATPIDFAYAIHTDVGHGCQGAKVNGHIVPLTYKLQSGDIRHVTVPGALEVPVALQAMAASGRYDALVALGCIIRGETYHFELVANESGAGVTRVSLDAMLPIANAILTTENLSEFLLLRRFGMEPVV